MRNVLTAALVGLSVVWLNPVEAQEMGTSEALKETLASKREKSNKTQEKTIDFQQVRQAREVRNIVGESVVFTEDSIKNYFSSKGTVPYLSPNGVIDGDKIVDYLKNNSDWIHIIDCYYYLSNNDVAFLDTKNLKIARISWACKDLWNGRIEIRGHCIIDGEIEWESQKKDITIIVNNWANFTEENAEGKEIAHNDTLYTCNKVSDIPPELIEKLTNGKWFYTGKIGLPKHQDPEYLVGYTQRISGNSKGRVDSEWGDVGNNDFPFNHYVSLEDFIKEADCTPYKEVTRTIENIWGKNYECILKFYSIIPIGTDWSTAHASIVWWGIPGKRMNIAKIEVKEIATYGKMNEGYDSTQIEAPKYYNNVGKEVTKDSLELGKTYQLKVQAKPDYKITSVIVNGKEYTLTEGEAFTIDFEVKENNKIEIKSSSTSGINWTEIKEPRISSENGTLTIDTQDTPLQSIQIYNVKGQLIAQKSKSEWVENFQLSQGLYFVEWRTVKGEWKTVKIMVK